jgi:putative tricarboxylic transport membrane protein
MFSAALSALSTVFAPATLMWIVIGSLLGVTLGMIPGLGGVVGMSILLPFVYGMNQADGIALLIGMVTVSATAEAFPAVLLGVPGTAASAATILDGYPLARQGKAAQALSASFISSMVGGLVGAVFMFAIISAVRPIIYAFGSPELFMLTLLGLSMVGTLSKGKPIAGLAAGLFGMALGCVGTAPELPQSRFTFGSNYLSEGIPLTVVAIGMFAIPELVELLAARRTIASTTSVEGGRIDGVKEAYRNKWLVLRSAIAGCFLGLIPGVGGTVIDWIIYGLTVRTSRDRSRFGKGDIRGVIGPDSANNSREGGNLIPTLLFGIPGGASMAVLLGGLLLLGIQVGPTMVTSKLHITLAIAWTMAAANVVGTGLCFLVSKRVARVCTVPANRLAPVLLVILIVAAFQARYDFMDVTLMLAFGVVGYMMKRTDWPRPPVLIGFVLAPSAEQYLHLSTSLYGWGWIHRPGVVIIAVIIIATLATGGVMWLRDRRTTLVEVPGDQPVDAAASTSAGKPTEPKTREPKTRVVSP